jgi:hypothetical protein
MSRHSWVTFLTFVILAANTSPALGALGDCGQPVTSGAGPTASDCLFILKDAVGTETCNPGCICDTNSEGGVTASDALVCLKKAVGQDIPLNCPVPCGTTTSSTSTTTSTTTSSSTTITVPLSMYDEAPTSNLEDGAAAPGPTSAVPVTKEPVEFGLCLLAAAADDGISAVN